jgi:arsenate reductase
MTAHWGQPDPAAVEGTDLDKTSAFREAFRMLERRIEMFTSLPIASLDQLSLGNKVREIGKSQ